MCFGSQASQSQKALTVYIGQCELISMISRAAKVHRRPVGKVWGSISLSRCALVETTTWCSVLSFETICLATTVMAAFSTSY